jgi:C-terminal processing protease CtpA/Prc
MGDYIFRYLYDGKYRSLRKLRMKASWDIRGTLPWPARIPLFVLRGHTFSFTNSERRRPKPDTSFAGHTYLLTDNGTFSMAAVFAAMARDYKLGKIIGYETGGLPDTFGGPYHFTLKNSGIPCIVSSSQILSAIGTAGDDQHGVIPDVPLDRQKLAEFRNEKDPVLAYTLHYIENVK